MALLAHWPIDDGIFDQAPSCRDIAGGGSGAHTGSYVIGDNYNGKLMPGGYGGRHLEAWGGTFAYYGSVESIAYPEDLRILGALTISGWFWHEHAVYTWSSAQRKFVTCSVANGGTSATNNPFYLKNNGRKLVLTWQHSTNTDVSVQSTSDILQPCGVQHITVVRYPIDAEFGVRFYLNGELVDDEDNGGGGWLAPDGGGSSIPYIARDNVGRNNRPLYLDSIRIYNEALSNEAVATLYDAEDHLVLVPPSDAPIPSLTKIGVGLNPYKLVQNGPFANRVGSGWGTI